MFGELSERYSFLKKQLEMMAAGETENGSGFLQMVAQRNSKLDS